MAHNPIFGSDPVKPDSPADRSSPGRTPEGGSDLGELTARFAAHGGGRVSLELSADLALEIVLNEIVEQACLATAASGAAIVLERGGEWVCRATAGGIAPQLGARLDTEAGLSGACVKTRTVQRCDDAQTDTRADMEACRILGVRSVIILPLLKKSGEVMGVFEVFSSSPSAFGERDEQTLEGLAQRVLRNLERAAEPMAAAVEPPTGVARALAKDITAVSDPSSSAAPIVTSSSLSPTPSFDAAAGRNQDSQDRRVWPAEDEAVPSRGMNILTWALAAVVLAFAVLLSVLVTERLGGRKATTRAHAAGAVSAPAESQSVASKSSVTAPSTSATGAGSSAAAHATATSAPPGTLLVYDNGKEVFRMPPGAEKGEAPVPKDANAGAAPSGDHPGMQRAASVEAAATIKVAPEVAEGSLIHRVEPDYPEEALRQQMQGSVELDVRTGRDGAVREVKLLRGQPVLADAAITAVKQWRFTPRMVEGQPVEMQTKVTLNFRLPH